ncbi:hypothetical protein COV06_03995 [Candidatus Uhrbacteria bacterium CG10_big_fil_rev_8_21_14_0_10_50_16]|uniref:Uncharacterized protein n=1 Tax=Candidatus Uhrbacteria bacterium CG10_big_fil_rev_8_21_14_0_10_50_16 TaxID=1975039 RepID=A0A2H0RLQ1_9BACT|nr:MAG: hypothetical protein COV06_03995 [Candidatus Uhrbacteria bacterium CG10_big_fil_rev_8_21_14_0_10_50_16]
MSTIYDDPNREDEQWRRTTSRRGLGPLLLLAILLALIGTLIGLAWNSHRGDSAASAATPSGPWIEGINSDRWSVDMTGPSTQTVEGKTVGVWRVHIVDAATGAFTGYRWCQLGAERAPARCLSKVHEDLDSQIGALNAPIVPPPPAPTAATTPALPAGVVITGDPALVAEFTRTATSQVSGLAPGTYNLKVEKDEFVLSSATPGS